MITVNRASKTYKVVVCLDDIKMEVSVKAQNEKIAKKKAWFKCRDELMEKMMKKLEGKVAYELSEL